MKENKKRFALGFCVLAAVLLGALIPAALGLLHIEAPIGEYFPDTGCHFRRTTTPEEEDFDEAQDTLCPVVYENENGESFTVTYTYAAWEALGDEVGFSGVVLREAEGGRVLGFPSEPTAAELKSAVRDLYADEANGYFTVCFSLLILAASIGVIVFFGQHFTLYEKCWFLGIMALATFFSILMPEESCNGVSGIAIMILYLADTFLNILCELLISKQSKWNFLVSVFVELTEILICVVLAYRFATMATTLLFWLPCDIVSFVNWNRKPDENDEELTRVRTLTGWQEVLILVGIAVWTLGVGYLLTLIDFGTELFAGNEALEIALCYLDACVSAVAVTNGILILLRFREQWISWFIDALLEATINILTPGQLVLLPLKLGYLTNSTYGYIRWTKYIKEHPEVLEEKTFL